ncbi:MAG: DUF362 domain-containing protein [Candidatus Eisenbacteria bacterium]|nr:DUF362 domain-containing protein [Candidatus Eisenbacteria bacterium]
MKPLISDSTVFVHDLGTTRYEPAAVKAAVLDVLRGVLGTSDANPLRGFVAPGDTVLIKPNMIRQSHVHDESWEQVMTHGTVIAAVAELCCEALAGRGRVVIGDGPQNDADFDAVRAVLGLDALQERCRAEYGCDLSICDFRVERWIRGLDGVTTERVALTGDPRGFVPFDLAERSEFVKDRDYYGAESDFRETQSHHSRGVNRYLLGRTAVEADVFINLPKLKTHKKVGVTLSLKNLVGIHGHRNYLPHHVMGTPRRGGDEYPDASLLNELQSAATMALRRTLARRGGTGGRLTRAIKNLGYGFFGGTEQVVRSGNWHGNDTAWRMVLDLNKLLFYGDSTGAVSDTMRPRRYLSIVDGIVGGEGPGPLAPDPKPCGVLIGGRNPVAVDCVCARLMGFDTGKIPMLGNALGITRLPLAAFVERDIAVRSNREAFDRALLDIRIEDTFRFAPHFGWKDHIELA